MEHSIKRKLHRLAKQAKGPGFYPSVSARGRRDNLMKVIRNQKDADHFLAELEAITRLFRPK